MKVCLKCGVPKNLDEFHKRENGVQSYCKECRKNIDANYWKANKDRLNIKKNIRRQKCREFYNDLKNGPCTDCGNKFHPVAMQWDHIGTDKEYSVSSIRTWGREAILREIAKCELVCANCHAVRTFLRT